jgi:uncharacterized membrane-anchored protein YhcB (DUF1043 family)
MNRMSPFDYQLIGVFLVCVILWAASTSLPRDVWLTALGVLLGAVITAVYSRQASKELRKQAERLRQEVDEVQEAVDLVHRAMEETLGAEFLRDPITGKRKGVPRKAAATSEARISMEARGKVVRHKDDPPDDEA